MSQECDSISKREKQRDETRRKIIDSAFSSFTNSSIRATSLNQIAKEVGISKGTIFHHFPEGKSELAFTVFTESFNSIKKGFKALIRKVREKPDDYKDIFGEFLISTFEHELNNPSFTKFMLDFLAEFSINNVNNTEIFMQEFNEYLRELIELFSSLGMQNSTVKTMLFFSMLDGMSLQLQFEPDIELKLIVDEMLLILETWIEQGEKR